MLALMLCSYHFWQNILREFPNRAYDLNEPNEIFIGAAKGIMSYSAFIEVVEGFEHGHEKLHYKYTASRKQFFAN
jgi:hypothetical protein